MQEQGGTATIAVKANRTIKPAFDQHTDAHRHRIETLFARIKNYRRIATRYEKLALHFNAMPLLACISIWLNRQPISKTRLSVDRRIKSSRHALRLKRPRILRPTSHPTNEREHQPKLPSNLHIQDRSSID